MKKSRKLLALVLAMMMTFSLMSMSAAAYGEEHEHDCAVCSEDEVIQPRRPSAMCSYCGTMQIVIEEGPWSVSSNPYSRCAAHRWIDHLHTYDSKFYVFECGHAVEVRNNDVCHWGE
jgi:hypothetical protein